ncbi:MAG TPA: glycosyl hydrolase family 18 protein [Bryobacteraceae bacterium]|jgi:chitinase|nr:glycosyl hydrolase family 18 protein [Bryobacteraceae bacterium]
MVGRKPELGGTTTIPTVLVPVALSFRSDPGSVLNPASDIPGILHSPIFEPAAFATGNTQYGDAVLRAQFYKTTARTGWHTLLGRAQTAPAIQIDIPAGYGYILHSKRTGKSLGIVDLDFVSKSLAERAGALHAGPDKLLIAVTKDTAFYALGDATVCCSIGSHGAALSGSKGAAQPFVLASYMDQGAMPRYSDVQGISQQVAEWLNDPFYGSHPNQFPPWVSPQMNGGCEGPGESSAYLMEQPTDGMPSNATQISVRGKSYHLENMALLPWFTGTASADTYRRAYSFPDTNALSAPAHPCSAPRGRTAQETSSPIPESGAPNGHALIGYWEGYSAASSSPLRSVSPQWDVVIATFAAPVKGSTSLLKFQPPSSIGDRTFKADVAFLQSHGKKVLISLGGGGAVVTLNTDKDVEQFVRSVTAIVDKYGFDGVDLDIETPSLLIDPGDTDFRRPTTASIVNLIIAMHELHEHFGPKFMISEVPEAAQTQAGMVTYGGQFGSFVPVIYGTRDILSFVDAQDYNTPPLEGLDGNYYFPGNADYHVAMSEMLLKGFSVRGNFFPPLPPQKVAVGLPATPRSARNYTAIPDIENALGALLQGKTYAGAQYKLQKPSGYPTFLGAMFWAINEDKRNNYQVSNSIGPFLHNVGRR